MVYAPVGRPFSVNMEVINDEKVVLGGLIREMDNLVKLEFIVIKAYVCLTIRHLAKWKIGFLFLMQLLANMKYQKPKYLSMINCM